MNEEQVNEDQLSDDDFLPRLSPSSWPTSPSPSTDGNKPSKERQKKLKKRKIYNQRRMNISPSTSTPVSAFPGFSSDEESGCEPGEWIYVSKTHFSRKSLLHIYRILSTQGSFKTSMVKISRRN